MRHLLARVSDSITKVVPHEVAHGAHETINALLKSHTIQADDEHGSLDFEGPKLLKGFTRSRIFTNTVCCVILSKVVAEAIETDHGDATGAIAAFEHLACAVFLAEMIMKILDEGKAYFKSKGNLFDLILSWFSILDIWAGLVTETYSSLRLLRILTVVRIIRHQPQLRLCFAGINAGSSTMTLVAALIGFLAFIMAIFMTQTVGRDSVNFGYNSEQAALEASADAWNNYKDFGTVSRSMFTMLELGLGIGWSKYASIFAEKQMPWMLLFIFCYMAFVSWGLMNAIIAVVVSGVQNAVMDQKKDDARKELKRKRKLLHDLAKHWTEIDRSGNGQIDAEEMQKVFEIPEMREILGPLGLAQSAADLVRILDRGECEGVLSQDEFLRGMYRWIECPGDWKFCVMKVWSHNITQIIRDAHSKIDKNQIDSHTKLDLIMAEIQKLKSQVHQGHQAESPAYVSPATSQPALEKPLNDTQNHDHPADATRMVNREMHLPIGSADLAGFAMPVEAQNIFAAQVSAAEAKTEEICKQVASQARSLEKLHEQLGDVLKAFEVQQVKQAEHAAGMDHKLDVLQRCITRQMDHILERLESRKVEQTATIVKGVIQPFYPEDVSRSPECKECLPHEAFGKVSIPEDMSPEDISQNPHFSNLVPDRAPDDPGGDHKPCAIEGDTLW
eukprot:gnl/MRDRNA2_/MRDRNA2_146839_c0_seq1.p1 gnl/MRDRNA2_/MRDRNA2_146839_c0~~gnl/MRDRNA2_/MRDRNA2_146839_c0_seq1.p1  ORF type:complete len:673 (-),score=121.96 gnl/MRDRNA2_/MRDRNA2_146839_c0_seq1:3-2021(-)